MGRCRIYQWISVWALLLPASVFARARPPVWLEVRSPHFTVVSDAGPKQAQHVAGGFERVRAAFRLAFPEIRLDPSTPFVIIAVKDRAELEALMPPQAHLKGAPQWTGWFEESREKDYALIQLNTGNDSSFRTPLQGYTFILAGLSPMRVPLWLSQGLSEYYGDSLIENKEVVLGKPDGAYLSVLRQTEMIPLKTLLAVNRRSPYYNREDKMTVFDAETWALTHYLMSQGFKQNRSLIAEYIQLLGNKMDPVLAATEAFGNLDDLENNLDRYVRLFSYTAIRVKGSTVVDDSTFVARPLSRSAAEAVRGDFLAATGNVSAGRAMLEDAIKLDPQDATPCESMGFLEYRQGHVAKAEQWFARAVQLNTQNYLTQYYYGTIAMSQPMDAATEARVESSLRESVHINRKFAPAWNALASFYSSRGEHFHQAHTDAVMAVQLDPSNFGYRITTAQVLLQMMQPENAIRVAESAEPFAHSMAESSVAEEVVRQAQRYMAYQKAEAARAQAAGKAEANQETKASSFAPEQPASAPGPQLPIHPPELVRRGSATAAGDITAVQCTRSAGMEINLHGPHESFKFYADDYFNIRFRAIRYSPTGVLHPCQDLKGRRARVTFHGIAGHPHQGKIISIDLYK